MPAVLLLVGFGPISGTHQEGDPLSREPSHASLLPHYTSMPPAAPSSL